MRGVDFGGLVTGREGGGVGYDCSWDLNDDQAGRCVDDCHGLSGDSLCFCDWAKRGRSFVNPSFDGSCNGSECGISLDGSLDFLNNETCACPSCSYDLAGNRLCLSYWAQASRGLVDDDFRARSDGWESSVCLNSGSGFLDNQAGTCPCLNNDRATDGLGLGYWA